MGCGVVRISVGAIPPDEKPERVVATLVNKIKLEYTVESLNKTRVLN